MKLIVLFCAAVFAGVQNALAGGGSFVTLPALLLLGMDARAANVTSTVALFPGQVTTGLANRRLVRGTDGMPFGALCAISLAGGALGALLLLATPTRFFDRLIPFLVLFATGVFVWGSVFRRPGSGGRKLGTGGAAAGQFLIAVYGGYFGGGIGLLMLAALTLAGLAVRHAGATKNALASVMNASAVAIFVLSGPVHWAAAGVAAAGAVLGGLAGARMLTQVSERALRGGVVAIGAALTVAMFVRGFG